MTTAPSTAWFAADPGPTDPAAAPAVPRFRVCPQASPMHDTFIVVAVDGDQTSRISAHPLSAYYAAESADVLNHFGAPDCCTAAFDLSDQAASEAARAAMLARIEMDFPPQIRPTVAAAAPLNWRSGVAAFRMVADDAVNTYLVERHSNRSWELCAWNTTSFDDVPEMTGIMTPTRILARDIAAEFSALGENYMAAEHCGNSRVTEAILAAYHQERAQHAVAAATRVPDL